ncbi:hypothetical protein GGP41_008417 [Bipolaris sorokiniana]|uniref:Anaphase-promoting complex subunit 4 WD40 domain-containing protein n=1 Tax=Cochliobolus sativus TaxID=45130 RepID=A0A8H6DS16_COCSA|nr:hypothetical protein GGP41_008417 [Bipolaris sorokiniana]
MSREKRPANEAFGTSQLVKRTKSDANLGGSSAVAVVNGSSANGALIQAGSRASALQSPVMELTGHSGEVFAARFDPTGQCIASGSMDRSILLWRSSDTCENYGILTGHKQAVLDLHWSRDSKVLFSASADMHLASWDTDFPITAICLAEAGNELFTGGIDNDIKVWDLRKQAVTYTLIGHTDTVTSLQMSPDNQTLLSNAHDSTVRTWDVRPFAPADRRIQTYDGAPTGQERNLLKASWDFKGEKIAAGSGDQSVAVWETRTGKLLHKLPGHRGAVNDVRFHPLGEPILVSASSDRKVMVGELGK